MGEALGRPVIVAGTTALLNSFERVTQQFDVTPAPCGAGVDRVDDERSTLERVEESLRSQRRGQPSVAHLPLQPGSEAAYAGRVMQLRK